MENETGEQLREQIPLLDKKMDMAVGLLPGSNLTNADFTGLMQAFTKASSANLKSRSPDIYWWSPKNLLLVYLRIFALIRRQDDSKLDFLKEYILKYSTEEYGIEQSKS